MTAEERARQAYERCPSEHETHWLCLDCCTAVISAAVDEEREACARIADAICEKEDTFVSGRYIAKQIRQRKDQ